MKTLIIVLFLACGYLSCGQMEPESKIEDFMCGIQIETIPKWTDGSNKKLSQLIMESLVYPKDECIEGITVLGFTVDTLGNVVNPIMKRSLSGQIDSQLLEEIVKHKFIPGKIGGRVSEMSLLFPFKIILK